MRHFFWSAFLLIISLQASRSQEFLLHEETFVWTKDADPCGGYHYWYNTGNAPSSNWKVPYDYENGTYYFRFEVLEQPTTEPFKLNMCIWTEFNGSTWKEECTGFSPSMGGAGSIVTYSTEFNFVLNGVNIDWTDLTKLWRIGNPIFVNNHNLGPSVWCTANPEEWVNVDKYFPMKLRITIVAVASGHAFSGWSNYTGTCTPGKQPTPNYSIDYQNVTTNKPVSAADEYSYNSNMTGAVSGNGQKLALTPGSTIYFRTKKVNDCILASDVQTLVIPSRPAAPAITVDYTNERTIENIASTIEYSTSAGFTGPVSGTGNKVALTPGQDLYFRQKSTAASFASNSFRLIVPARNPAPSISIDYAGERTSSVPSTMEWSTDLAMSTVISGTSAPISVTPGTDMFFRFKSDNETFASSIQSLNVPDRPPLPTVSVDFINERTNENIGTGTEWSTSSSMGSATLGTNVPVAVSPGANLYFRIKSTGSSFASGVRTLNVPVRPAVPQASINYPLERTAENISSDVEWSNSVSMSPAFSGTNSPLVLTPGNDVYFRKKPTISTFKSEVLHLNVPLRAAMPAFSPDFTNETTYETVETEFEYSDNADMISAVQGTGNKISLNPGSTIYFRKKASDTEFKSLIQELILPPRPSAPAFAIDYCNEATSVPVTSAIIYSMHPAMTESISGSDVPLDLTPGSTIYFRKKATATDFASEIQALSVSSRRPAPAFAIDFLNERTTETISGDHEFDTNEMMDNPVTGSNEFVSVEPGTSHFFRLKCTSTEFSSEVFLLNVPERPVINASAGDTIRGEFTATVDFHDLVTGFDSLSLQAENANIIMIDSLNFNVIPIATGFVSVIVSANAIGSGNFESEPFTTFYENPLSIGAYKDSQNGILLYPNPAKELIHVEVFDRQSLPVNVKITDGKGILRIEKIIRTQSDAVVISDLPYGIYILESVDSTGKKVTSKFLKITR